MKMCIENHKPVIDSLPNVSNSESPSIVVDVFDKNFKGSYGWWELIHNQKIYLLQNLGIISDQES